MLLRELEGVLQELAAQAAVFPPHADDVEARVAAVQTLHREIVLRGALDLALLATIDGLEGATEAGLRACLHLDEGDGAAVECNQIDLAGGAAIVARQDLVALAAQELLGRALALGAEDLPFVRHGGWTVIEGDENEKPATRQPTPIEPPGAAALKRREACVKRTAWH